MTEIERIIRGGVISNDFLKEEIRSDFRVDEKRKRIWAIQLDLYQQFAQFCEKHGLRHYAAMGTLLGAVRHQGFVPWDDDTDVYMPRKDYEEFIKIAPDKFKAPYLVHTPKTDEGCYKTILTFMNTRTTAVSKVVRHAGIARGLMLDVFPLDECNPATLQDELKEIEVCALSCSAYMKRNDTEYMTPEQLERFKKYMTNEPMKVWKRMNEVAMSSEPTDSYAMKVYIIRGYPKYNLPMKKEWFASTKKVKFETIEMTIPTGYHEILTTNYGNYMKFPPVEERGRWHDDGIHDPDRPYTDYID